MIFVDSWAWIGLADRSDPYHGQAKAQHKNSVAPIAATLPPTTSCQRRSPTFSPPSEPRRPSFLDAVLASVDSGQYLLVHVSPDQFRRAWLMRQKYHDKPDISFVDFTSMIVMQDLRITEVFTGDAHFRQVSLGFQLVP